MRLILGFTVRRKKPPECASLFLQSTQSMDRLTAAQVFSTIAARGSLTGAADALDDYLHRSEDQVLQAMSAGRG
jgi:hypothetical protein